MSVFQSPESRILLKGQTDAFSKKNSNFFGENKTKNGIIGFVQQFKTREQTSPVGRSLAVQEADYKSKVAYRLSEPVPMKTFEGMRAGAGINANFAIKFV